MEVSYEQHVMKLAELAKLQDASTKLVRKIQQSMITTLYKEELEELSKVLSLDTFMYLDDGTLGYFERAEALKNLIGEGSVYWDFENTVWRVKNAV